MKINEILTKALEYNASEVIFSTLNPPCVRLGGAVRPLFEDQGVLDGPTVQKVCASLIGDNEVKRLAEKGRIVITRDIQDTGRFRVVILKKHDGLSMVFRPVFPELPTLDAFGIPDEAIIATVKKCPGLVLFSGFSSSGRSTTMASALTTFSSLIEGHGVTLEDAVEFVHSPGLTVFDQMDATADFIDFAAGLEAVSALSPDVLAIDCRHASEHVDTILKIASSGTRVFMTCIGASAQNAVENLIACSKDPKRAGRILSGLLECIYCQKLVHNPDKGSSEVDWQVVPNLPPITDILMELKFNLIDKTSASTQAPGFLKFTSAGRSGMTSNAGTGSSVGSAGQAGYSGTAGAGRGVSQQDINQLEKMLYDKDSTIRQQAETQLKALASQGVNDAKTILSQFAQFYVTNFEDQKQGGIKR